MLRASSTCFSRLRASKFSCKVRRFSSSSAIIHRFSRRLPRCPPMEVSKRTDRAEVLWSGLSKPM